MKKTKAPPQENIRDTIGLTAANDGDPSGVWRFLRWCSSETSGIGFFGRQPEIIALRMRGLAHDMEKLSEFARGYAEGASAKKP